MAGLKEKVVTGFVWAYGEKFIAYAIQTAVTIILARLIEPSQYGLVSIVTVMIAFADIFASAGFGSSLVQKKDADSVDFNTAFTCGLIMSCILYSILFVTAPAIEKFYKMQDLGMVIRVMAIRIPIASLNTIQRAKIQKNMEFKKFFFSTLIGTLASAFVGVGMAVAGCGIWALVGQYLTNAVIDTIVLLITGKWFPKIQISLKRAKEIMGFGWKVLIQNFIYTLTENIQSLVIGKKFSAEELAYYDHGSKIPQAVLSNIYSTIGSVMFPALSDMENEYEKKKRVVRQSIQVCTFLVAPIAVGMIAMSNTIILLLYTEKWLPCVPFLQIYCLRYLPRPLTTISHQSALAAGRSDIVLKIEIIVNICLLTTLFIASFIMHSVLMIAWGTVFAALIDAILYAVSLRKLLGYTYREQIQDTFASYVIAVIMGIVVYAEKNIFPNIIGQLCAQGITIILLYLALSYIFNRRQFLWVRDHSIRRK